MPYFAINNAARDRNFLAAGKKVGTDFLHGRLKCALNRACDKVESVRKILIASVHSRNSNPFILSELLVHDVTCSYVLHYENLICALN